LEPGQLNRYRLKKGYHNSQKNSNKSDELNHDNIGTVEPKTNAIKTRIWR